MTRPAGFYEVRQDGHICWFRPDTLSLLSPRVFEPSHWQALDAVTGSAQGRGTAWFVVDGKQSLVLRHYHRGGLFGRLVKDLYVGLRPAHSRAMRELALLESMRSEEHTSELQSRPHLVCRLLLEKKKNKSKTSMRTTRTGNTPS